MRLGVVAHTCNPQQSEQLRQADDMSSGVQDQLGQHGETPSLLKIQKLAGCGTAHLNPATWKDEVGGSLEPKRQRLQ